MNRRSLLGGALALAALPFTKIFKRDESEWRLHPTADMRVPAWRRGLWTIPQDAHVRVIVSIPGAGTRVRDCFVASTGRGALPGTLYESELGYEASKATMACVRQLALEKFGEKRG